MRRFGEAASGFATLVDLVPAERLDGPGLGTWTLRELIGHTARALSTVVDYLALPEPAEATIGSAAEYLEVVLRQAGDDAAIEARGRAAAAALGDDLVARIGWLAGDAWAAVQASDPHRLVAVGSGGAHAMRLDEYLNTRCFELTVHGIDIADAAGVDWRPAPALVLDALHLAASNAAVRGHGLEALRLLTGRRPDAGLDGILAAGR
ncbi:maleylpyruvate isomerase N-terminal domain-containing protein [Agrococcus terreus]|uniref:maleylpyruvate isomerase N-terminal domain-containing protein n=1 Tax=Agrococcus terreus TaxID=574649 RepID=UPI00385019A2